MITLLLLHPLKRNPVQSWSFESESVIRIGRSTDNHVILYSAVVSRHHVELRQVGGSWEIVNLGTNGTYLDGKRITKVPIADGAIIRLARSGPNIQIRLGTEALKDLPEHLTSDSLAAQRIDHHATVTEVTDSFQNSQNSSADVDTPTSGSQSPPAGTIPVPAHLRLPNEEDTAAGQATPKGTPVSVSSGFPGGLEAERRRDRNGTTSGIRSGMAGRNGTPTAPQALQTVGTYEILSVLGQGDIGITYLAKRDEQLLILKTLNAKWSNHPKARAALEVEAEILSQLDHASVPEYVDFFSVDQQPYLVMERVDGPSLAQQVSATEPMSLERAIAWMLKVCAILSYLHEFVPPVLHRNIEPANLIQRYGSEELVLVGFGAVKALVLERRGWVGSNGYAAPDQLSISASPQVDLYALGPTLAYLLTGKNPVTFCKRDGEHPYQFMADAVSGISDEVRTVLKRLTHPNEELHYANVEAVSEALRSLV